MTSNQPERHPSSSLLTCGKLVFCFNFNCIFNAPWSRLKARVQLKIRLLQKNFVNIRLLHKNFAKISLLHENLSCCAASYLRAHVTAHAEETHLQFNPFGLELARLSRTPCPRRLAELKFHEAICARVKMHTTPCIELVPPDWESWYCIRFWPRFWQLVLSSILPQRPFIAAGKAIRTVLPAVVLRRLLTGRPIHITKRELN